MQRAFHERREREFPKMYGGEAEFRLTLAERCAREARMRVRMCRRLQSARRVREAALRWMVSWGEYVVWRVGS